MTAAEDAFEVVQYKREHCMPCWRPAWHLQGIQQTLLCRLKHNTIRFAASQNFSVSCTGAIRIGTLQRPQRTPFVPNVPYKLAVVACGPHRDATPHVSASIDLPGASHSC
jgi:hypothetical protein